MLFNDTYVPKAYLKTGENFKHHVYSEYVPVMDQIKLSASISVENFNENYCIVRIEK